MQQGRPFRCGSCSKPRAPSRLSNSSTVCRPLTTKTRSYHRAEYPQAPLAFTGQEIHRLETMVLLDRKLIRLTEAMALLKLSKSQICRLLSRFRCEGAAAARSAKRGLKNRASPLPFRHRVLDLITRQYRDYGPTLLSEVLAEGHDIHISRETIRKWMIAGGMWTANRAERKRLHQPRQRLHSYGALIQVDGSDHDWFEQRAPRCTLMVYVRRQHP